MRQRPRALLIALAALVLPALASARVLQDSDGDGLPDAWERHGVTLDTPVGPRFVDLPAMGADPMKPDVFLQIDWMADETHDQRPSATALRLVREAFAGSPYRSPTGSIGISLHIDAGPDSVVIEPDVRWASLSRARVLRWQDMLGTAATGTYDWQAFQAIRDGPGGFRETGRGAVFHYAVFGHYHDRDNPTGSGASGISRGIGGTDLLITLGNFTDGVGSPREQAGTLMHELGHNLGLRHGGCDDNNSKPGYASVMNYAFQMDGLVRGGVRGVIDYSRGMPPVLDDALLPPSPPLLAPSSAPDATNACVAPGEVRAGLAVRAATAPPDAEQAPAACDDGAGIDDWRNLRLDVGSIGRPEHVRRHAAR
jgi:hypothetical protein